MVRTMMLGDGGCGRCFEDYCFEGHSVGNCGDGAAVRVKFYMSSVLVHSQFWFRQYYMIILKYFLLISK